MGPKRHGNSEHKKYQPAQLQQLYYTGGPIHTPLWDQGNGDFIYTHTHTHTSQGFKTLWSCRFGTKTKIRKIEIQRKIT